MFLSLKSVELVGFKSFGKKVSLEFTSPIAAIVGPNGSGKSNVAEAFRFVLGEQSMKSLRSKRGEDLIWGGSPAMPRGNRAAVKVTFDNSRKLLDLDFQEVTVERVVHRDGQNEYLLNGTQVRLKDIVRLLAGANIGGSGYHIISQGEADRILNASPRERREMVEDSLGLKLYQHKKIESERQLAETKNNLDKAKSLRREIAPHLTFLRSQVEKIEKAREMQDELGEKLKDYLSREHAYVTQEATRAADEEHALRNELNAITLSMEVAEKELADAPKAAQRDELAGIRELESALQMCKREREQVVRDLGRAEAELELGTKDTPESHVSVVRVRSFLERLHEQMTLLEHAGDLAAAGLIADSIRREITAFESDLPGLSGAPVEVKTRVDNLGKKLKEIIERQQKIESDIADAWGDVRRTQEAKHSAERTMLTQEANKRDVMGKLIIVERRRAELARLREQFEEEVREGIALIGSAATTWEKESIPLGALSEARSEQEKRRRAIERLKIKIEESGTGNSEEVSKEYQTTFARDQFLEREVTDLEASVEKLELIIVDLEKTIDAKFEEGLKHINVALKHFFSKLFGGGEAKLEIEAPRKRSRAVLDEDAEEEIEDEDEELYAGLSIHVSLPRKKVRGLEVLSGGERALTSIALIFSMSQVHPPPFLILDETDAALDEANSKRYADMVQELAEKSQLIVITHNRATMAAAGELYGVTMGQDGVSKLLSVKLEEAERVAK